jgi:hypothetical protein
VTFRGREVDEPSVGEQIDRPSVGELISLYERTSLAMGRGK